MVTEDARTERKVWEVAKWRLIVRRRDSRPGEGDREKDANGGGGRERERGGEGKREEAFQDAITTFLGRASNQQLFL